MTLMTPRQQITAVLDGNMPDRIPWAPRLEIWHKARCRRNTLPEQYQGWTLKAIYKDLGMCVQARAHLSRNILRSEYRNIEVHVTQPDRFSTRREYFTPVGRVSSLHRTSEELERDGIQALEVEHMIKTVEDYRAVEYIVQHTEVLPTYDEYLDYEQELGEDGVILTYIGQDPMSWLIFDLIGYEQVYYHLADHPREIDHLYRVLEEHCLEKQRVALESPARLIMHGQHFDTQITPPRIFKQYILPYYQPFAEKMQSCGKVLACHADANTAKILGLIKEAGFKLLACFLSAPMVSMTMEEARATLGTDVILWGGIPSILLDETTGDAELEGYLRHLFHTIAPGEAFILGVADNVMPDTSLERLQFISRLVYELSACPIEV